MILFEHILGQLVLLGIGDSAFKASELDCLALRGGIIAIGYRSGGVSFQLLRVCIILNLYNCIGI